MTLSMTPTLIAIAAAYVVMGVLLLAVGLTSRFAWWVKAAVIVITSAFFSEVFFASKGLLGWPGTGALPPKFQLLWSRVVEPDPKMGALRVTTDQLLVLPDAGIARTSSEVHMQSTTGRAVAEGLELDNKARTLKLDRVRSTIKPNPRT